MRRAAGWLHPCEPSSSCCCCCCCCCRLVARVISVPWIQLAMCVSAAQQRAGAREHAALSSACLVLPEGRAGRPGARARPQDPSSAKPRSPDHAALQLDSGGCATRGLNPGQEPFLAKRTRRRTRCSTGRGRTRPDIVTQRPVQARSARAPLWGCLPVGQTASTTATTHCPAAAS